MEDIQVLRGKQIFLILNPRRMCLELKCCLLGIKNVNVISRQLLTFEQSETPIHMKIFQVKVYR